MNENLFQTLQIKEQPLAELVAEQISNLIIEKQIQSGQKLPNEFDLAQQLHVGRGTIREAVKLLVAKNVLEIQRGKGTFVAKHTGVVEDPFGFAYIKDTGKLAKDLLEMRLLIEPWAAATAAERATKKDIEIIQSANENVNQQIRHGGDYMKADENLHVAIARCTQSLVLPKFIPVIIYSVHQLSAVNDASLGNKEMKQVTMETHQNIIDAISRHQPEEARLAMTKHLESNLKAVETLLNQQKNTR